MDVVRHRLYFILLLLLLLLVALFFLRRDIPRDSAGIVFIGDSITLGGSASAPSNTYVALVTADLDSRGVQDTDHVYISVDPKDDLTVTLQAAQQDRRFVVIELGIHAALDPEITPEQFRANYAALLDCAIGDNGVVVAGTIPWLGWPEASPAFARAEQFSRIIEEEAQKRDIPVADLWSATKLRHEVLSTPDDYTFLGNNRGDNFHPGDTGHAVIAEVYSEALDHALSNPPDSPPQYVCAF